MEAVSGRVSASTQALDRNALFEHWMDLYGDQVLRVCIVYLKNTEWAKDAAQDTFVKAYRGMDAFNGNSGMSEKAWLMRIAVNTCKDILRSSWLRRVTVHADMSQVQLDTCDLTAQDKTLLETVMALPDKIREVVTLYYYQSLTMEEVAAALGISKSTVHSRLEKAKSRLRHDLERWYYDE